MIKRVFTFLFVGMLFVAGESQATYKVLPIEKPEFEAKKNLKSRVKSNNLDGVERVVKIDENGTLDGVMRVKKLERIENYETIEEVVEPNENNDANKIYMSDLGNQSINKNISKDINVKPVSKISNLNKNIKNNIAIDDKISTKNYEASSSINSIINGKSNTHNIVKLDTGRPVIITTNTGVSKIINTTNTAIVDIHATTNGKKNNASVENSDKINFENNGNIDIKKNENSKKSDDEIENDLKNMEIKDIEIINHKNKIVDNSDTRPETIEIKIGSNEIEATKLVGSGNGVDKNSLFSLPKMPKIADIKEDIKNSSESENEKSSDANNTKNKTADNEKGNGKEAIKPVEVVKNQQLAVADAGSKNKTSSVLQNQEKTGEENRARQVISSNVAKPYKKSTINVNDVKNDRSKYHRSYEDVNGVKTRNNKNYEGNYTKINKDSDNEFRIIPKTRVVKNNNFSNNSKYPNNLKIINKIEQNLMYSDSLESKAKIDIKKGGWSKEDLVETQDTGFEIRRTSKKIEAESTENERDATIAKLKDLAYEATKMREYEIAVKLYKEVLRLNNKDNFAKLSLATSYHMLGQYVQAKPIYIELLPVFPNSEQLASNLLSIIIQESPYEAIYLLPTLASKYSTSAKIQAQTSMAFTSVERYDNAIEYIQKAINLDEENYEYKYNLAVLYDLTKRYNQAYSLYKELYDISQVEKSLPSRKIKERLTQLKKYI